MNVLFPRRHAVRAGLGGLAVGSMLWPIVALFGVQLAPWQFAGGDPVITFETGSTALPSVSGVQFSGGDATFYFPNTPYFGSQYFGNLNGSTYLDIYFDQ